MKLDVIKKESNILYQEIDECITELLKARGSHDTEAEGKALFKMEGLMVGTLQHLSCITETEDAPSGIDEAAQKVEDHYDVGEEHGYLYCHRGDIKDAFKAGAEWMAGQGVSTVAVSGIKDGITEEGMESLENYLESLPSETEVVLQIRKKQ